VGVCEGEERREMRIINGRGLRVEWLGVKAHRVAKKKRGTSALDSPPR